jgi:fatty acid desaturase
MVMSREQPGFESPALQREIKKLRHVDNFTNLSYLAMEYVCLIAVIGSTVAFAQFRGRWGLAWSWNIPVFAMAIVLIVGIQHRLAGLGHEASHYCFLKNRLLNDLIPDLCCMFPLLTTVHFYRLFHMAHHQFTNDPSRDPDLLSLGYGRRSDEFPMTRGRFIRVFYFCIPVAPMRFVCYVWAYIEANMLGQGKNVYLERVGSGSLASGNRLRLGTVLGLVYLFMINTVFWIQTWVNQPNWLVPAGLIGMVLAAVTINYLPERAVFRSPLRSVYSTRFASVLRLGYYTLLLAILSHLRWATGGVSTLYVMTLWLVPLGSSFMFFMFLRDVYQHSNADAGCLTNSRVFFTDPFTRWAVFVYGQDMHIPHHLFPAIRHYRLRRLHELLKRDHEVYRGQVVETYGTFHNSQGHPTILDEMTRPRAAIALNGCGTSPLQVGRSPARGVASAMGRCSQQLAKTDARSTTARSPPDLSSPTHSDTFDAIGTHCAALTTGWNSFPGIFS